MLLSILQGEMKRRGMLELEKRHSSGILNRAAFECSSVVRQGLCKDDCVIPFDNLGVRLPQRLIAQRVLSGNRMVREGIRP
ncbi:hypothetical protein BK146_30545 [Paenibacillus sp. FSL R7-0333]|nr:hypothetical protein BK146_30545 [Paenibacillus sp. FSL R7-0333]